MRQVIQGLEEGLQSIAEALEGGGSGGIVPTPAAADEGKVLTANDDGTASWETPEGGIPTPTLDDEGKVLKAVPQTQTTVAPEWGTIRELPIGGYDGDVLKRTSNGYEWSVINQVPNGGSTGQVLRKRNSTSYEWSNISTVPSTSGVTNGYVLTNNGGTPTWAAASGGSTKIYRVQGSISKEEFTSVGSGSYAGMYKADKFFFDENGNQLDLLSDVVSVSIMVRQTISGSGLKFKHIDGAIKLSSTQGYEDSLYISAEDYNALDSENDYVYASIICVPDVV